MPRTVSNEATLDDPAPIERAEAKAKGLRFYFTGKPCKHGHVAEREVLNATCVECERAVMKKYRLKKRVAGRH